MAKRSAQPPETPPSITPARAIPLLEEQFEKLKALAQDHPINDRAHTA